MDVLDDETYEKEQKKGFWEKMLLDGASRAGKNRELFQEGGGGGREVQNRFR